MVLKKCVLILTFLSTLAILGKSEEITATSFCSADKSSDCLKNAQSFSKAAVTTTAEAAASRQLATACASEQLGKVQIDLEKLNLDMADQDGVNRMFFIENSDRGRLLQRQTCSIESAVKNAQMDEIFIVMITKSILPNNATCQILMNFEEKVKFR